MPATSSYATDRKLFVDIEKIKEYRLLREGPVVSYGKHEFTSHNQFVDIKLTTLGLTENFLTKNSNFFF